MTIYFRVFASLLVLSPVSIRAVSAGQTVGNDRYIFSVDAVDAVACDHADWVDVGFIGVPKYCNIHNKFIQ